MKINFDKVRSQFGDKMPSSSVFFNTQKAGVTRHVLFDYYKGKGATDERRYHWFVAEVLASKPKVQPKPKVEPKPVKEAAKVDEVK